MYFVTEQFDTIARRAGAHPAVVEEGTTLSYDHLLQWSETISTQLQRHRQMNGRRVVLVLPNSAAFVAAFFAVSRVGGIVAPLNVEYRSQELKYYLADIDPTAILASPAAMAPVREAIGHLAQQPMLCLLDAPGTCETLSKGDAQSSPSSLVGSDQPLLLLYTSGSTGQPKRVVRTHAQLRAETEALRTLFDISPADRFLGAAPFCHVNGLVRSMMTAMLGRATLYPIRDFARRTVLRLMSQERLTFFGGVPQMFVILAQTPPREAVDLSSLRIVFSSSAPLTPRDNREFHRVYGVPIRQLYGSTETGTISYNDHPQLEEHLASVGRPLPGITLAVVDDNGKPLPPGVEGEIIVSSPFAISSYEGNIAATQKSFRDGFYLTGDLGSVDPDGYVTLSGRKSLMINRGGYKVNPYEVEDAIRQYPKVAEVVVFGVPGPYGDDVIRCVVVPSAPCTAEEIVLHCRSQIATYKIPSQIEFRESLPKTPTGKIRRDRLRDTASH
jgi:long-chain acyl-CoA synthetase